MTAEALKQHDVEREKWVALVGRLIVSFGDIENITYLGLLQLPKDSIFESTSKLGFGARVDLLLEILSGHKKLDPTLRKAFSEKLLAAKKLAEIRNTVAHSPLMLSVYQHQQRNGCTLNLALETQRTKIRPLH